MTTDAHDANVRFLAEYRDLTEHWSPALEAPMTARGAAEVLVERGFDPGQARAMVAGYLDATSREVGVPVHRWGLDSADLDHIEAHHADPAAGSFDTTGPADEHGDGDDGFDNARLYSVTDHDGDDHDIDDRDGDGSGWGR